MTDLDTGFLERWAELEPERCKTFPRHATVQVKGKWNPAEFTGTILAAVIEAIEARGWDWNLTSMLPWNATARRYVATVTYHVKEADSDVAALLTAYLAALEAEGEEQA